VPDAAPRYIEPLLGVVFDLDGTLVLSQHDFGRMRTELIRLAERFGVTPGRLEPRQPIARLLDAARTDLEAAGVPEGTIDRMEAEAHRAIDAIELEALPRTVARRGAHPILKALTDRGFRLGLLTRSSERFSREALRKTGLEPYFGYLRTRSAPGPAKPSPEALLFLLKEMEVPRDRALFVGDHLLDVECAVAAQVLFYGLLADPPSGDAPTVERFQAAGASAVAASLEELGAMLGLAGTTATPVPPP
jgi:HAD superfamily hydrolase (TIGR01549 family)